MKVAIVFFCHACHFKAPQSTPSFWAASAHSCYLSTTLALEQSFHSLITGPPQKTTPLFVPATEQTLKHHSPSRGECWSLRHSWLLTLSDAALKWPKLGGKTEKEKKKRERPIFSLKHNGVVVQRLAL